MRTSGPESPSTLLGASSTPLKTGQTPMNVAARPSSPAISSHSARSTSATAAYTNQLGSMRTPMPPSPRAPSRRTTSTVPNLLNPVPAIVPLSRPSIFSHVFPGPTPTQSSRAPKRLDSAGPAEQPEEKDPTFHEPQAPSPAGVTVDKMGFSFVPVSATRSTLVDRYDGERLVRPIHRSGTFSHGR